MKKIMVLAVAVAMAFVASARPHGGFDGHHGGFHHGHGGFWGRGGRNFWPAFAGGVVGGMVGGYCYGGTTVVAAPAAVTTVPYTYYPVDTVVRPVEAYQQVWVPGQLVPVTNPDGSVSYVRQPGHYERVRIQ